MSNAPQLFRIAECDLTAAQALAGVPGIRLENAMHHVQQSIEKAIKAVLVFHRIALPLVHDLGIFVSKVRAFIEPPYGYKLQRLTDFATIRRYEEGESALTPEELRQTLQGGLEMLIWAKEKMRP